MSARTEVGKRTGYHDVQKDLKVTGEVETVRVKPPLLLTPTLALLRPVAASRLSKQKRVCVLEVDGHSSKGHHILDRNDTLCLQATLKALPVRRRHQPFIEQTLEFATAHIICPVRRHP